MSENESLIIAMDGPSGTGKSTVSRRLAARLDAAYLDTGAMYRAATVWVLQQDVDPADVDAVSVVVESLDLAIGTDPEHERVSIGGVDVTGLIRSADVTGAVSAVSAVPAVRNKLVAMQRELATTTNRIVVEGRDIGTVVLVDADLKIFLTASAETRARRRNDQNIGEGRGDDFDAVLADVERRDDADSSRVMSPLRPAEDSKLVDTSELGMDDVIDALMQLVTERSGARQ